MGGEVLCIPVKVNGKEVGCYAIWNLFNKYGNGDGENHLKRACMEAFLDALWEKGYEGVQCMTVHNPAIIEIERRSDGKTVWETNDFCFWESEPIEEDMRKIWEQLPEEVREVIRQIAEEGLFLVL